MLTKDTKYVSLVLTILMTKLTCPVVCLVVVTIAVNDVVVHVGQSEDPTVDGQVDLLRREAIARYDDELDDQLT